MRWMRGLTLGGVAMLAGCLEAESVRCSGSDIFCPAGNVCVAAPVFCAPPDRVAACEGQDIPDFGTCQFAEDSVGACRSGACFECVPGVNELAGCEHTGWFPMVSNTTVDLHGIWTAGPAAAFAVGGNTIVRYDGFEWKAQIIPDVELTAVWGSDLDHVFATTAGGAIYQRAEDDSWAVVHDAGFGLQAVGGSGPDDVIALNSQGRIVRSTAAGWAVETITTTDRLYGIAVRSRDDVFVAGTRGVIHRSMGTTWPMSRLSVTGQATLNAIAATPAAVFAIGDGDAMDTSALRLPAGQSMWISDVIPNVPNTFFHGIWASAEGEAFAVGVNGRIVRYVDNWTVVESSVGANVALHAIHGSDRRNVFAVGEAGTIVRYVGQ